MTDETIRFSDGAAYERYLGKWSQLAGEQFLDWLAPSTGLAWLDVGAGNGAFTELLVARSAPSSVVGIDPSEEQLEYARTRFAPDVARFVQGDAQALPFRDDTFDAAVMPLVIFFVPDPKQGVAEMARVVRSGGIVTAYAWDMVGGGFPYAALQAELRAMNVVVPAPPSAAVSRLDALESLWADVGLERVETTVITVQRTFADFDDYFAAVLGGPSVTQKLATMNAPDITFLQGRLRERLPADAQGRITYEARANAIQGRVP